MAKKIIAVIIMLVLLAVLFAGCNEQQTTSNPGDNDLVDDGNGDTSEDDNNEDNASFVTPSIVSFSVEPYSIGIGDTAELRWVVSDAESISIDNGIGYVSLTGSRVVSPTVTTTYTMTARNGDKEMIATVEVIVVQVEYNLLLVGTWNLVFALGDFSYDRYVFNADKTGLFGQTYPDGQLKTWQGIDNWVVGGNTLTITENFNPDQPMPWTMSYDGEYLTLTNQYFSSISGVYKKV